MEIDTAATPHLNVARLDEDFLRIFRWLESDDFEAARDKVKAWVQSRTEAGTRLGIRSDCIVCEGWEKPDYLRGFAKGTEPRQAYTNIGLMLPPVGVADDEDDEAERERKRKTFQKLFANANYALICFVLESYNESMLRRLANTAIDELAAYLEFREVDVAAESDLPTHTSSNDPFALLWGTTLKGRELEYMGMLWNRETNEPVQGVTFELICRDVYEAKDRERPLVSSVRALLRNIDTVLSDRNYEVVIGGTPNDGYNRPVEIRLLVPR